MSPKLDVIKCDNFVEVFFQEFIAGNFPASQNILKNKRKAKGKGEVIKKAKYETIQKNNPSKN